MKDNSRLFVIPVDMENRDPEDIARDAAEKIGALFDRLIAQMNEEQEKKETEE